MKNSNLLNKTKKVAFVTAVALGGAVMANPCVAKAEVIVENEHSTIYTEEDVPEYIRQQHGDDVRVGKHSTYNTGDGWVRYYNIDYTTEYFAYVYGTNEDGTEYLAHEVWIYYDLSGGRRERAWYENGISVKVEKLESVEVDKETSNGQSKEDASETESEIPNENQEVNSNWIEENGKLYWYEEGVKQGTEGRGKEIYDPVSDAWYWLDAVQGGAMATNKNVYQDSYAGGFADNADGTGKWVRYDEKGHMVKGWYKTEDGTYFFDEETGAMAKGIVVIDGFDCSFDTESGIFIGKEESNASPDGWYIAEDGKKYWYEDRVRQGLIGRGKEIYDLKTNAWYWCDSVQNGAIAISKDVYQESWAGSWGDIEGEDGQTYGKWVRYDENGHMIKGWDETEDGKYYFSEETGAMAKGWTPLRVNIRGEKINYDLYYKFDSVTGRLHTTIIFGEAPKGANIYCEDTIFEGEYAGYGK